MTRTSMRARPSSRPPESRAHGLDRALALTAKHGGHVVVGRNAGAETSPRAAIHSTSAAGGEGAATNRTAPPRSRPQELVARDLGPDAGSRIRSAKPGAPLPGAGPARSTPPVISPAQAEKIRP
jgi:hypothetical protein